MHDGPELSKPKRIAAPSDKTGGGKVTATIGERDSPRWLQAAPDAAHGEGLFEPARFARRRRRKK